MQRRTRASPSGGNEALESRSTWGVAHLLVVSFGFTGASTLHQFPHLLYKASGRFFRSFLLTLHAVLICWLTQQLHIKPVWVLIQVVSSRVRISSSWWASFDWYFKVLSGAFLLPYFLSLIWLCVPLLYVQFRIGGVTGCNVSDIVSKHLPILKGKPNGLKGIQSVFNLHAYENTKTFILNWTDGSSVNNQK